MKRFFRSIAGKISVFLLCIIAMIILAYSIAGSFIYLGPLEENRNSSWEDVYKDLANVNYRSMGYDILFTALDGKTADYQGMEYEVTDSEEKIIQTNREKPGKQEESWEMILTYDLERIREIDPEPEPTLESKEIESETEGLTKESVETEVEVNRYTVKLNNTSVYSQKYVTNHRFLRLIQICYELRYRIFIIAGLMLILTIASFTVLMCVAGRRPSSEDIYPGPLYKVPYDIMILLLIGIGGIGYAVLEEFFSGSEVFYTILAITIAGTVLGAFFLGFCMSTAVRIKKQTLFSNTVIAYLLRYLWKFMKLVGRGIRRLHRMNMDILKNIPLIWKVLAVLLILSFIEFVYLMIFTRVERDMIFTGFFIEKLILIPSCLYTALCLSRLKKGGELLAKGDLSYVTDTSGMFGDMKTHGENLNNIAVGMNIAVEEQIKSERMKTELITNVSHDLKTPLTSVINYSRLIANEETDNERIKEYSDVLLHQSERLKRLIEDLVEASKASTGNLEVNLEPCDASLFLMQAAGEYEEKLSEADLSLVVRNPEEGVMIMADGRRMWRIFDNLMNNILKYAQEGTRVYLSLEKDNHNAVITFKNTSRDALDVTEEELMERFVRGDVSRNTEGNGLGLSIARSLAELQNGHLQIAIDGDLFKAILTFPTLKTPL